MERLQSQVRIASVRRVMCSCGRVKTVRSTDTRAALAYAGWVAGEGPAWTCPACVIDLRVSVMVRDVTVTQSALVMPLP